MRAVGRRLAHAVAAADCTWLTSPAPRAPQRHTAVKQTLPAVPLMWVCSRLGRCVTQGSWVGLVEPLDKSRLDTSSYGVTVNRPC